jgi:hypothetical protein
MVVATTHPHPLQIKMDKKGKNKRSSWNRKGGGLASDQKDSSVERRHKGSYSLEEIKESEDYRLRRITGTDDGLVRSRKKVAICFGYLGSKYQGLQVLK